MIGPTIKELIDATIIPIQFEVRPYINNTTKRKTS